MKTFIQTSKVLILSIAVLSAMGYAQAEWNSPSGSPTGGNTPTPINVSDSAQVKSGSLTANVIGANGFCLGSDCISEWPESNVVADDNCRYASFNSNGSRIGGSQMSASKSGNTYIITHNIGATNFVSVESYASGTSEPGNGNTITEEVYGKTDDQFRVVFRDVNQNADIKTPNFDVFVCK